MQVGYMHNLKKVLSELSNCIFLIRSPL